MKNLKIGIAAMLLFALLAVIVSANPIAPPVNQQLGLPDSKMVNMSVDTCRGCHPGAPNIHHYMISGGQGSNMTKTTKLGCVDCHPVVGGALTISKNCHDCHDGTVWAGNPTGIINLTAIRGAPGRPHHNTTKNSASNIVKAAYVAADRQCTTCHGSGYLANYNDGHYVPTYNVSMVTPVASYKINDSGKLWGGCLACHDDGVDTATGQTVFNSDTTHHTARFWVGYQCNNCHVAAGFRAEPTPDYNTAELNAAPLRIYFNQSTSWSDYAAMFGWDLTTRHMELRNSTILNAGDTLNGTGCEKCHSIQTLHNIETASPGPDGVFNTADDLNLSETLRLQIPGYGHIGNNSDCNGCHQAWAGSTDDPFPGPKAMSIYSVTPGVVTASVATDVVITGSNFVEAPYTAAVLVDGTPVSAIVTETSITASVNLAAGAHSIVVKKDTATTSLTSVMAVAPGTIASANLVGTTLTIDGAALGADQTMVVIAKADGTLKASDSIISSTDTQTVAVASLAAVGDTAEVITPTGKATATIVAGATSTPTPVPTPTPTPTPVVTPTPIPTPTPDSVTVTYLNATGLTWKRGTPKTVTWNKAGSSQAANVKIELLKGTIVKQVLASSTPNDGKQSVTISSGQATGTDYKIRITSLSHTPTYSDLSDNNFGVTK